MTNSYASFLNGKNHFFEALYQEHHATLLMVAYKYLRNQDDAEDVIADVYKKLLGFSEEQRKQMLPKEASEFVFYIRRMVKNKSLDSYKQKNNQRRLLSEHYSRNADSDYFNEQDFLEPQLQELIQQVLNHRELEIISLHVQGYKNKEIAQKLDLSYFTVRNMISVSKKKLKTQYKKYFQ